jgi:bifunctional non-homologous end joining protein LigD
VHPVADRRDALVWLANQNCVTPHAWLSRRDRLDEPDLIVIDLDPTTTDFAPVRAAARACADVLDDLGLTSYLKTTGSRGLHVVVPSVAVPTTTRFDSSRAMSPTSSPPTIPPIAPSRCAKTNVGTGCTST